jgi:hypothetical protein
VVYTCHPSYAEDSGYDGRGSRLAYAKPLPPSQPVTGHGGALVISATAGGPK